MNQDGRKPSSMACACSRPNCPNLNCNVHADAALIAAAPELYEAMKESVSSCPCTLRERTATAPIDYGAKTALCAQPRQFILTSVKLQATVPPMTIRGFAHKGLKRLYEDGSTKGVPADSADKLRKMLAFLDAMQQAEELRALQTWKVHTLTGDRKATWSLSVTRNRRLTFWIDDEAQICDVNLEDYH
jgi:toxin HigB-1